VTTETSPEATQTIRINQIVDEQRFGKFNLGIMVLGWFATFADGYDISAASYAAPALIKQWHIDKAAFTAVFSVSLIAYFFGAPCLGWVGDRFGRKRAIILGCLGFGLCSFASMAAANLTQLLWLRFLTGFCLAGLAPCVLAHAAEFSPRRIRALMMTLNLSGVVIGGSAAGWASAAFLYQYGWRSIFFVGGVLPLLAAALIYFLLPESIKFLVLQGGRDQEIARLVRILKPGIDIPPGAQFIIEGESGKISFKPKMLFEGGLSLITPLFWVMGVVNYMTTTFINSWTPVIFQDAGMSPAHAAVTTSMYNVGGVFGGILVSTLLDRVGISGVAAMMALGCGALAAIGTSGLGDYQLMGVVLVTGFLIQGSQFGINAVPGLIYGTAIRANGLGWATAVGRAGATLGPILGGWLIAIRATHQQLFLAPVGPELLGVVCCLILVGQFKRRFQSHRLDDKPA
jgi:AAHS family 4-hydroxybenzoate transporter-like MFS transporter